MKGLRSMAQGPGAPFSQPDLDSMPPGGGAPPPTPGGEKASIQRLPRQFSLAEEDAKSQV